jgi:hypothetical protein
VTGETVKSKLRLKRGSNTVIAVSAWTDAAEGTKLRMLADQLGELLGGEPEHVGDLDGTTVWVIGLGRPTFLRPLEENDRLAKWYRAMGEPVGPDREFWSVTIDWRGDDVTLSVPADTFVIPASAKVVHGRHTWPDGNAAEQAQRVETAGGEKRLSDIATNLQSTYRHIARSMPSSLGTGVILGSAGVVIAVVLLRRRIQR